MATLQIRLQDLATRIATEIKANAAKIGDVATLVTTAKTVVPALNELKALIDQVSSASGATINDASAAVSGHIFNGGNGGASSITANSAAVSHPGTQAAGVGAAGGCVSTGNAAFAGGRTNAPLLDNGQANLNGGANTGVAGQGAPARSPGLPVGGMGGSGGGASLSANAGAGGDGQFPGGGGGGGGAAVDSVGNSGAGGAGAGGLVVVTSYF